MPAKRGVKSPDRAEAVMLAFAMPALGWMNLDCEPEVGESASSSQLRNELPFDIGGELVPSCGECANFRAGAGPLGRCGLRAFPVAPDTHCCEWFGAP
jgi:hypothetical protein